MSRISTRAGTKTKHDPKTGKKFTSWFGKAYGTARKTKKT